MNANRLMLAIAMGLVFAVASSGRADEARDFRSIRAQYDRMAAALVRKDAGAVTALLAPAFTNKGLDHRTTNRDQMAETLRLILSVRTARRTIKVSLGNFRTAGNRAFVTATCLWITPLYDPKGTGRLIHTQFQTTRSDDTWIQARSGEWLMLHSEDRSTPPPIYRRGPRRPKVQRPQREKAPPGGARRGESE